MSALPSIEDINADDLRQIAAATPVSPKNLRVEMSPYPHLRDDEGCILANDFLDFGKLAFILEAVSKHNAQCEADADETQALERMP